MALTAEEICKILRSTTKDIPGDLRGALFDTLNNYISTDNESLTYDVPGILEILRSFKLSYHLPFIKAWENIVLNMISMEIFEMPHMIRIVDYHAVIARSRECSSSIFSEEFIEVWTNAIVGNGGLYIMNGEQLAQINIMLRGHHINDEFMTAWTQELTLHMNNLSLKILKQLQDFLIWHDNVPSQFVATLHHTISSFESSDIYQEVTTTETDPLPTDLDDAVPDLVLEGVYFS